MSLSVSLTVVYILGGGGGGCAYFKYHAQQEGGGQGGSAYSWKCGMTLKADSTLNKEHDCSHTCIMFQSHLPFLLGRQA